MVLTVMLLLVTMGVSCPCLIPTEADWCPDQARLEEETLPDRRLYRCTTEAGRMLWEKPWCPAVPKATAAIAAPACAQPDPAGAGPFGLLGLPHFHCDLGTLTWRFECRDGRGMLLWEVAL